jgi:hypothetical protein
MFLFEPTMFHQCNPSPSFPQSCIVLILVTSVTPLLLLLLYCPTTSAVLLLVLYRTHSVKSSHTAQACHRAAYVHIS